MESYFNLPRIGELVIEHLFYAVNDEPILFVCKDTGGSRYLCSCCMMYEKWVIAQTDESTLMDLIDDKIAIRDVFESRNSMVVAVSWDGNKFDVGTASSDFFPRVAATLELPHERNSSYYNLLNQKTQQDMWSQTFKHLDEQALQAYISYSRIHAEPTLEDGILSALKEFATYWAKMSVHETMKRLSDTSLNTVATTPEETHSMRVSARAKREVNTHGHMAYSDCNYYAA